LALLAAAIAAAQDREPARPAAVEVFNSVEGRTTVLSNRPEGTAVAKGDVVCELDLSPLQDRLTSQEIVVRAVLTDLQGARLARQAPELALTQYKVGQFVLELAASEGEIKLAESELARAEDHLDWSRRMFDKGYASMAEKVSDELLLKKAMFALERAQSQRKLLIDHTKDRTIKQLLGEIETARARELGKEAALAREQSASRRLGEQIRRSKVVAPIAGWVHYLAPIGAGAVVHDGEVLFRVIPEGTPG
jgi:multidrug resistance efflux pump